ncbi:MAG: hypothetical protein AAB288_14025, partial [Acidobacteriota bacterium]
EAIAKTTLSAVYALMERQPKGESGEFLTNGYANIFYVRDATGKLRAVCVFWDAGNGGWGVDAGSVGFPFRWHGGRRVFSRNS